MIAVFSTCYIIQAKMINCKYRKIILISFAIVFAIMSVITGVLAENTYHTQHCTVAHCPACILIHAATSFIKNIVVMGNFLLVLMAFVTAGQFLSRNVIKKNHTTLVEQKVIQNK